MNSLGGPLPVQGECTWVSKPRIVFTLDAKAVTGKVCHFGSMVHRGYISLPYLIYAL